MRTTTRVTTRRGTWIHATATTASTTATTGGRKRAKGRKRKTATITEHAGRVDGASVGPLESGCAFSRAGVDSTGSV